MSFWKKIFGGGDMGAKEPATAEKAGEDNYKGHAISAVIMPVGGELQLAGQIEKDINGERKVYKFIRADRFTSRDDLVMSALAKGRQIIDEQGDGIYR